MLFPLSNTIKHFRIGVRFRVEVRHTKLRAPRKRRRRKREEEVWMSKGSEEAVSVLSDATKCPHLIFSLLNKNNARPPFASWQTEGQIGSCPLHGAD